MEKDNQRQNQLNQVDFDNEEDFEFVDHGGQNKEDDEFDTLMGALQDIVIEPAFEEQQRDFLERNCMSFEDQEENQMEHMTIFKEYQDKVEGFIEKRLKETRPELDMKKFLRLVESRFDEIDPQLADMLQTFTDFQIFKEHMLDYKKPLLSRKKKSQNLKDLKQDKESDLLEQDLNDLMVSGHAQKLRSGEERRLLGEKEANQESGHAKQKSEDKENLNIGKDMNIVKDKSTLSTSPTKKTLEKPSTEHKTLKENILS